MIIIGNKKISKIKLGDQTIGKVYVGDSLVFPTSSPLPQDVNVVIKALDILDTEIISPEFISSQVGNKVSDVFDINNFISSIEETPPGYIFRTWKDPSPVDYTLTEQDAELGEKTFIAIFEMKS